MMMMMQKWVTKQLLCYRRDFCTWRSCEREFYFSKAGREESISHYVAEIVNGCHGYCQINVQQYAAFETPTHLILFTQRNESQELNQGTPLSSLLLLLASQVFAVIILLFNLSAHCRTVFLIQMKRIYTGCPRRNGQNFGRVFLMLNYTDITQNTYIQSWTVTEIMAREVWNFDSCYTLIDYQIHIKTGRNMWFL